MVLENIGSLIEDTCLDSKNNVSKAAWNFYLFSDCGDDKIKVFHKYVDSIAFRYKFELSLIPALFISLIELAWITNIEPNYFNTHYIDLIAILIVITFIFTYKQANTSCKYLNNLRCAFMATSLDLCKELKNSNDKNEYHVVESCDDCEKATDQRCQVCGQES